MRPLTQPVLTVLHGCPRLLWQAPVESQVPAQRPATGSSALVTATQVPDEQVVQAPGQSLAAQQLALGMQVEPQGL